MLDCRNQPSTSPVKNSRMTQTSLEIAGSARFFSSLLELWYPELPCGLDVLPLAPSSSGMLISTTTTSGSSSIAFFYRLTAIRCLADDSSAVRNRGGPEYRAGQPVIVSYQNVQVFQVRSPLRGMVTRTVVPWLLDAKSNRPPI